MSLTCCWKYVVRRARATSQGRWASVNESQERISNWCTRWSGRHGSESRSLSPMDAVAVLHMSYMVLSSESEVTTGCCLKEIDSNVKVSCQSAISQFHNGS